MNRVETNGNGNNNKKKGTCALEKIENESKTSGTITTKTKANKFPFRINLKDSKAMGSRRLGGLKRARILLPLNIVMPTLLILLLMTQAKCEKVQNVVKRRKQEVLLFTHQ